MITIFKVMCQLGIKKRITLPEDYFQLTEHGMLFIYYIDGHKRFITFNSREEVAEFMLAHEMIDSYTGSGRYLNMFERKLFTITIDNKPVQWTRITKLKWEKIKFYPSDVKYFASLHEFELQGGLQNSLGLLGIGKPKAKVISMVEPSTKRAA